jgi:peptide/nickel transport system ATP-binding protein
MAYLEAEHLSKNYAVRGSSGKRFVRAVDDVSLSLEPGEILGVIGESGCGKSTLGRMLIGLEPITSGQVTYEGRELSRLMKEEGRRFRGMAQMVFQNPFDTFPPGQTMQSILQRVMKIHGIGKSREERRQMCLQLLEEAGLVPAEDFLKRYPHELSGGQLQRLSIVRSMMLSPSFLVADEPVSMLDVSVRADIINMLTGITKKKHTAMVFISHDLATTRYISDRIVVMYLGRIVESGDTDQVLHNPRHPYTRALLSYCASIDPREEREQVEVPGEASAGQEERIGCYFAPRCFMACDRCFREQPLMQDLGEGHRAACHRLDDSFGSVVPSEDF